MQKVCRIFASLCSRFILCIALAMPLLAAAEEPHVALVNINSASAETMADALYGVGISKAEAIVAFRDQHGPFEKPEDLVKVKGIGGTTVANNMARIQVN